MQSKATTVKQYLREMPADRREVIEAVREVILANLDPAFEEIIQYNAIGYVVPHSVYPGGYHCTPEEPLPFCGIANQKNHVGLSLFCVYVDDGAPERFRAAWEKTGKKLNMGKSCVRITKLEQVPLEVVGRTVKGISVKRFIKSYEAALSPLAMEKVRKAAAKRAGETGGAGPAKKKAAKKTAKKAGTKKAGKKTVKKAAAKKAAKKTGKKATKKK